MNPIDTAWSVAQNFAAIKVMDFVGVNDMIKSDPNFLTRNVKRGAVMYLSSEAIEQLATGNSNLKEMSLDVAMNDTIFDVGSSMLVERLELADKIYSMIPKTNNPDIDQALVGAVVHTGVEFTADWLAQIPNWGQKIRYPWSAAKGQIA